MKEDEDVKGQDEEDDEDDEEAEEDKGDGSAHSGVVADLNEAPGERGALENSKDETRRTRGRRRQRRRRPRRGPGEEEA